MDRRVGQIVGQGTHSVLLTQEGIYSLLHYAPTQQIVEN